MIPVRTECLLAVICPICLRNGIDRPYYRESDFERHSRVHSGKEWAIAFMGAKE